MTATLHDIAREATDLADRDASQGHVRLSAHTTGTWNLRVFVRNEFAYHHCDDMYQDGVEPFGVIEVEGRDLQDVMDRALARVEDAVADTPCEQVPA